MHDALYVGQSTLWRVGSTVSTCDGVDSLVNVGGWSSIYKGVISCAASADFVQAFTQAHGGGSSTTSSVTFLHVPKHEYLHGGSPDRAPAIARRWLLPQPQTRCHT